MEKGKLKSPSPMIGVYVVKMIDREKNGCTKELVLRVGKTLKSEAVRAAFGAIMSTFVFMVCFTMYFILPSYNDWILKLPKSVIDILQILIIYVVFFIVKLITCVQDSNNKQNKDLSTYSFVSGIAFLFITLLENLSKNDSDLELLKVTPHIIIVFLLGTYISPLLILLNSERESAYGTTLEKYDVENDVKKKYNVIFDSFKKAKTIIKEAYTLFCDQFDVSMDTTTYSIIAAAVYSVIFLCREK